MHSASNRSVVRLIKQSLISCRQVLSIEVLASQPSERCPDRRTFESVSQPGRTQNLVSSAVGTKQANCKLPFMMYWRGH